MNRNFHSDTVAYAVWSELERLAKRFRSHIVGSTITDLADATGYSEYRVKSALNQLEDAGVLKTYLRPGPGLSTFELLYDLGFYSGKTPRDHEQVRNILMEYYRLQRRFDLLQRWKKSVLRKKKDDTELL